MPAMGINMHLENSKIVIVHIEHLPWSIVHITMLQIFFKLESVH